MKKITFTKVLLFALLFGGINQKANAQIAQGSWMIGGGGGAAFSSNGGYFTLAPKAGYFVLPKTAIGASVYFGHSRFIITGSPNISVSTLGISPFVRQYFLKTENKFNVFGELSASMSNSWNSESSSSSYFSGGISAGVTYFIHPNVGLEFISTYSPVTSLNSNGSQFVLSNTLGFQIYLGRKSK